MESETIVNVHQIVHSVLLETNETVEGGSLLAGAVHAVNNVPLLLLSDKQDIEYLDLKKIFKRLYTRSLESEVSYRFI